MKLQSNDYVLSFIDGGCELAKQGRQIYANKRPMFATVKTFAAASEFYDSAYHEIERQENKVIAKGVLRVPSGSAFAFEDTYETARNGFRISRKVEVVNAEDDLGFSTKISFNTKESEEVKDYNYFSPGIWYKHNEFAPDYAMGKDMDCEYFWRMETAAALPLFAMHHQQSGEMIAVSRWAADVTMRSTDILRSENSVDPNVTVGAVGISKPDSRTLNYMYYGYAYRKDIETQVDGLSIDYVYPAADGQMPSRKIYGGLDFKEKARSFQRLNHPVEKGFLQSYSVVINLGQYDHFQAMMKNIWRITYKRLRDDLFVVDNEKHFHNCMNILTAYTNKYGESYGLPFACQLPHMDVSCVSYQFGFVGQQPGIGYQLLRYGDKEGVSEAFEKGEKIIDFWVNTSMTDSGLPQMCYNPNISGFEPYPYYIRMLADGIEAILDAWTYMKKQGKDRPAWFDFCKKTADWCVRAQNEDGSFYRAYHLDGSVRMDSKANTPSIIRFLVQFYLITHDNSYKTAALKAGEWSYVNAYQNMEYRGGTCDNLDILDKEAGIYALFGFLSLYDLTGDDKWLEATVGAADYTETWTYAWKFPVQTPWPKHPFNQYSISGQSIITVGGGADVYMAACAYVYYRLYLITGDDHYRDFAEFIHKNTRQSNDVDGSSGYIMPGLGHESGNFVNQTLTSHYHWLPWCTYVEVDPSSRLYDTFGSYEIDEIEKLPIEVRTEKNKIYNR